MGDKSGQFSFRNYVITEETTSEKKRQTNVPAYEVTPLNMSQTGKYDYSRDQSRATVGIKGPALVETLSKEIDKVWSKLGDKNRQMTEVQEMDEEDEIAHPRLLNTVPSEYQSAGHSSGGVSE